MTIEQLVSQVVGMRGFMPEPNRTIIALRFAGMVTRSVTKVSGATSKALEAWKETGIDQFLEKCELTAKAPDIPLIDATAIDIDSFARRWLSVNKWKRESSDEWVDMEECQKAIVHSMLHELKQLAGGEDLPDITRDINHDN